MTAAERYNVVVSCVLYDTPPSEIERLVAQFARSGPGTCLIVVDIPIAAANTPWRHTASSPVQESETAD